MTRSLSNETLLPHLLEGTEENHERAQSVEMVSCPKFKI
jgi:hypothetical protein